MHFSWNRHPDCQIWIAFRIPGTIFYASNQDWQEIAKSWRKGSYIMRKTQNFFVVFLNKLLVGVIDYLGENLHRDIDFWHVVDSRKCDTSSQKSFAYFKCAPIRTLEPSNQLKNKKKNKKEIFINNNNHATHFETSLRASIIIFLLTYDSHNSLKIRK